MSNLITNLQGYDINQVLSDAWLNVVIKEDTLYNPLMDMSYEAKERPELYYSWLLTRPEYLGFAAKILLNIELAPFQTCILQEMWNHKFPIVVATRGGGKAEPIDTPLLTEQGWIKMGDVKVGDRIYGRDGYLHNITNIYPQGKKQVCRVHFADGRFIDCCEDHLWVVKKGCGKEKVLSTKEIIESGVIWGSFDKQYTFKYKVPNCNPIQFDKKELPIDPYILGCLLGNGTMNSKTPKISSSDDFIINTFREKLPDFDIELDESTNNNYTIVDRNKDYTQIINRRCTYFSRNRNRLTDKIEKLNLSVSCKFKFIPDIYKYSSIEDRFELVRGLLDTDGCVNKSGSIEFTNTCERLVDDLIDVLRSLGISCIKSQDNREGEPCIYPGGLESTRGHCYRVYINTSKPVCKLPRKLSRLKTKTTGREEYNAIISAEYTNEYTEMQCISVDNPDKTYITKDYIVTHNTFMMAVYSLLRALLVPKRKVVIVGSVFRQSKLVFNYIKEIYDNAPILRSIIDDEPHFSNDRCFMHLGSSKITALPVGNTGDKIRGERSTEIIADEFACLRRNSLLQTDLGIVKIENYLNGKPYSLLNKDNEFEYPDTIFRTPLVDVYRIKTRHGFTIDCSEIHQVLTNNGWKKTLELTNKDYIRLGNNDYFPPNKFVLGDIVVDEKLSFLTGRSEIKEVPDFILQSPKECVLSFLKGLYSNKEKVVYKNELDDSISFLTPSSNFAKQLQLLLLKFNILSSILNDTTVEVKDSSINLIKLLTNKDFKSDNLEYLKIESITKLPEQEVLYDFHMPKTHSFVANGFVQHNSQSKEIFETVIAGFGAVSSDPMTKVKQKASKTFAKMIGLELEDTEDEYSKMGNQIILSGTAYYYFNHFAKYWEQWRNIIRTQGDPKKIQEFFGEKEIDPSFNWKDYSIVRLPADLLPPGFMDESQLARSKATLPSDLYELEFSTIFSKDSNGFFKASLIDKCTANDDNDIKHACGTVVFEAKVKGDKDKRYVMGVDPASEADRFAIVIIELHEDHRRIVYSWTTNTEEFKQKKKSGLIEENDFYGYTARKIRDLMILFPCEHIAIDSQGGGKAVYEALHDRTKLKKGELLLWEIIDDNKEKDSDGEEGLHIIELVNFASAEYTSTANHTMKKDFEDRVLLFPRFNPAISAVANALAEGGIGLYDTFEDCLEEIEELKKELAQIVITLTASGRERWDTPDVKISGSEKGKLRKDRYSALLMANAAARKISGPNYMPRHDVIGLLNKQDTDNGKNFLGPSWATNKLNDLYQ